MKRTSIQKTLFNQDIIVEYQGVNAFGEVITIPNFQPLEHDDNSRLDMKNIQTKQKKE